MRDDEDARPGPPPAPPPGWIATDPPAPGLGAVEPFQVPDSSEQFRQSEAWEAYWLLERERNEEVDKRLLACVVLVGACLLALVLVVALVLILALR